MQFRFLVAQYLLAMAANAFTAQLLQLRLITLSRAVAAVPMLGKMWLAHATDAIM
jgi:hypothetical protein